MFQFSSLDFVLKPSRFLFLCVAFSLSVSACSLHEPDHFTDNKVRIEEEKIVHELGAADLSDESVRALAAHYNKHGSGPFHMTLTYDPHSKVDTAMSVSERGAELAQVLRSAGVRDVQVSLLPVKDSLEPTAIISYLGYNALAPKDCTLMPGIEDRAIEIDEDYQLGCSVDTLFARQIARPKDLLGQETSGTSDGRRAANQVDLYRTGAPNDVLGGESASGE